MSSSWIDPLIGMWFPSLSLVIFILRSILFDMRIATPAFFCFPFAWNIFFRPLTFSLYVYWGLKWVSCRQHIYGSCFCMHSSSLCLLVGAFNPFMFKVIIDIYVSIAIFLIVWDCFCRSFSNSCISWLYTSLVVKLVCQYWIPLNFACLKSFLFLYQFWMRSLLGTVIFVVHFSHTLNISCHPLVACRVPAERSAVKHMGFPVYVTCCFSLAAFNIFSLCLVFISLISMCLGMFLFGFIPYRTLCASWTWLFPFPCWEIFNYNLFKKFLILSFSLLLLLLLLLSHFSHVQLCATP